MKSLKEYASNIKIYGDKIPKKILPFSSALKYGSITFEDGCYLLGAPEFIMKENFVKFENDVLPYTQKGSRVLLFAKYEGDDIEKGITQNVIPLGFVAFANPIRANAEKTFHYFRSQNVGIKVISGDNPQTVSQVAIQVEEAMSNYTVFGRVTPKQKQKIVKALQRQGHTVAMTGDGVNDILAMKDADCSVAMASGSEACAQAAQVVLLDSDFAHMPDLVYEGRRVVNNIERSASLFLVKNIFSLLLSVLSAVFLFTYPLEPAQISFVSMFTIGIPGFLLALEPNKNRIQGNFLKNVLIKALPGGLTDVIAVFAIVVAGSVFRISEDSIGTIATLVMSVVGFMILTKISEPLDYRKYLVIAVNVVGLLFSGLLLRRLFALTDLSKISILLMVIFGFAAESVFRNLTLLVEKVEILYLQAREKSIKSKK